MKRFTTETFFVPLKVSEELGMTSEGQGRQVEDIQDT